MESVDKEQYQNTLNQYNQRKLYIESEQFEIKVLHTPMLSTQVFPLCFLSKTFQFISVH